VIAAAVVVAVAIYAGVAGAVGSRQDPVGWQRMMVTSRASGTPQPGVCRALMNDPKALKAMQALRAEHQKDMRAWWDRYGSDPTSAAAQKALQALRREHRNDMRALLKQFGVTLPEGSPGMMGGGWTPPRGGVSGGCGSGWRSPAPRQSASPSGGTYGPGMMGTGTTL